MRGASDFHTRLLLRHPWTYYQWRWFEWQDYRHPDPNYRHWGMDAGLTHALWVDNEWVVEFNIYVGQYRFQWLLTMRKERRYGKHTVG